MIGGSIVIAGSELAVISDSESGVNTASECSWDYDARTHTAPRTHSESSMDSEHCQRVYDEIVNT